MVRVDLLCLGTGKASTHIYHGEPSTGYVVVQDGEPVLLVGAGLGIVRSCIHYCKRVPDTIYVSHNHTDHVGELPLLLSVEAGKGRRKRVFAEPEVMTRLLNHRLAEYHESINLSNRKLSDLAEFVDTPEGELTQITPHLAIVPHKAQHSERCFGFTLQYHGHVVLGWGADSGFDPKFYARLATAPVLLLDARQTGSYDHAGFENIIEYEAQLAAAADAAGDRRVAVYVSAYGTQAEMPTVPQALRIGQTLVLYDDLAPPEQPYAAAEYAASAAAAHGAHAVAPQAHAPSAHDAYRGAQQHVQPPAHLQQQQHLQHIHSQPQPRQRSRSPAASPRAGSMSSKRRGGHPEQRSADIRGYLSQISADIPYDGTEHDGERTYHFPLPGQSTAEPHQIKKFPDPAPGPRKIFVFNNESKGAPSRMFLLRNLRTLEQLKLKVAETLNIKPIRHLHRLDGAVVRHLDDIPHMAELVATKHAGAPFDIADLPLHVRVGPPQEY